jgi:hypothetical protein
VAIPRAPLYITLSTVVNLGLLFKSGSIYDSFVNTFLILIYLQISIYKIIILSIVLYVHETCFSHEGKNIEHSIDDRGQDMDNVRNVPTGQKARIWTMSGMFP